MEITLWFDGACEPVNPGGTGTFGFVLDGLPTGRASGWGVAGSGAGMTNNVAEYTALGKGLRELTGCVAAGLELSEADTLMIRGDSKLVVEQLSGNWACRQERLQPLLSRCRELLDAMPCPWRAEWVPRDDNGEADGLTRKAYEEATGKPFPERRRP